MPRELLRSSTESGREMSYELISDDEFANLPIDNERCFIAFERICRRSMTRMIDEDSSTNLDQIVREQYMSAVAAVAGECGIPNVSYNPTDNGNPWEKFSLFSLAVQGEIARLRIRQRGERHPYSVLLTGSTRTKIEHYISRIRDLVASSGMDHDRKVRLDEKLDQLALELGSQRLGFAKTMAILVGITTLVASVTTIAAEGQTAITHIMRFIGQDKESEDAATRRLAPPSKALPAPANPKPSPPVNPSKPLVIDDDIPF